jgi:tRNA C32,U32 (ribose-2'-O)-methylase TrmJ
MPAPVRIVLIDPSHPGNIGSVARAMKNMALTDLVLVRPRSFPHAESNALAAGADDILANARVVDTRVGGGRGLRLRRGNHLAAALVLLGIHDAARRGGTHRALPEESRAALLFGSERYGLGTEDLQYCNVLVRIPANPEYCSLNLAMAVQLLTYELFMAREQPTSQTQLELPLAPAGDVEHFYAHLTRSERNRFRGRPGI